VPTLTIPDDVFRHLVARAEELNTSVEDLAARLLHPADGTVRIDTEYHAECATDPGPVPTLAEVRAVMAKLPGSLSADLIADRDDR
jgi:hypothetical protein